MKEDNSIGIISIDHDIIIIHKQGHSPKLAGHELRDMCITIDPEKFRRKVFWFIPTHKLIDWQRKLLFNTTCLKVVRSQFDSLINKMFIENDWVKYPYIGLRDLGGWFDRHI